MCEQCSAEVDEYGQPLPGWMLCQATRDSVFMKKGQWGLVESNDPTFIWTPTPLIDPTMGLDDKDVDNKTWEEFEKFHEPASTFEKEAIGVPQDGWKLYEAGVQAGYDKAKHGRFSWWLFDHLGRWLKANPVPTVKNRFPRDVGDRE